MMSFSPGLSSTLSDIVVRPFTERLRAPNRARGPEPPRGE
jgi:hypothetical protein